MYEKLAELCRNIDALEFEETENDDRILEARDSLLEIKTILTNDGNSLLQIASIYLSGKESIDDVPHSVREAISLELAYNAGENNARELLLEKLETVIEELENTKADHPDNIPELKDMLHSLAKEISSFDGTVNRQEDWEKMEVEGDKYITQALSELESHMHISPDKANEIKSVIAERNEASGFRQDIFGYGDGDKEVTVQKMNLWIRENGALTDRFGISLDGHIAMDMEKIQDSFGELELHIQNLNTITDAEFESHNVEYDNKLHISQKDVVEIKNGLKIHAVNPTQEFGDVTSKAFEKYAAATCRVYGVNLLDRKDFDKLFQEIKDKVDVQEKKDADRLDKIQPPVIGRKEVSVKERSVDKWQNTSEKTAEASQHNRSIIWEKTGNEKIDDHIEIRNRYIEAHPLSPIYRTSPRYTYHEMRAVMTAHREGIEINGHIPTASDCLYAIAGFWNSNVLEAAVFKIMDMIFDPIEKKDSVDRPGNVVSARIAMAENDILNHERNEGEQGNSGDDLDRQENADEGYDRAVSAEKNTEENEKITEEEPEKRELEVGSESEMSVLAEKDIADQLPEDSDKILMEEDTEENAPMEIDDSSKEDSDKLSDYERNPEEGTTEEYEETGLDIYAVIEDLGNEVEEISIQGNSDGWIEAVEIKIPDEDDTGPVIVFDVGSFPVEKINDLLERIYVGGYEIDEADLKEEVYEILKETVQSILNISEETDGRLVVGEESGISRILIAEDISTDTLYGDSFDISGLYDLSVKLENALYSETEDFEKTDSEKAKEHSAEIISSILDLIHSESKRNPDENPEKTGNEGVLSASQKETESYGNSDRPEQSETGIIETEETIGQDQREVSIEDVNYLELMEAVEAYLSKESDLDSFFSETVFAFESGEIQPFMFVLGDYPEAEDLLSSVIASVLIRSETGGTYDGMEERLEDLLTVLIEKAEGPILEKIDLLIESNGQAENTIWDHITKNICESITEDDPISDEEAIWDLTSLVEEWIQESDIIEIGVEAAITGDLSRYDLLGVEDLSFQKLEDSSLDLENTQTNMELMDSAGTDAEFVFQNDDLLEMGDLEELESLSNLGINDFDIGE